MAKSRGRADGQFLEAIRFARCIVQVLAFVSSVADFLCSPLWCVVRAVYCVIGEVGYER